MAITMTTTTPATAMTTASLVRPAILVLALLVAAWSAWKSWRSRQIAQRSADLTEQRQPTGSDSSTLGLANTSPVPPTGGAAPSPPTWIDELGQAMAWPDRRWNDDDVLDLVLAVADTYAWLHDPRPYRRRWHEQGWESAIADFHHAAAQVGPHLQAALSLDLATALTATTGLPGPDPAPRRATAQAEITGLRARWADPTVLEAAWLDVADACRDPRTPYTTIAVRRDLFWQLVRAADRNTRDLRSGLTGILEDSALGIHLVRVRLGEIPTPEPGGWPGRDDAAGLDENTRLDLCRRLLTASTGYGHHVVWVAFDRARLNGVMQTVGPITFYRGDWVRGNLENSGPNLDQVPAELTNPDSSFDFRLLPEGDRIVLARVDLGSGTFTDAPRLAAEQAQAVVALASFHAGDRYWQPRPGYVHAIDGRVTASFVKDPRDPRDRSSTFDSTADELARLSSTLGPQLPVTDPALTEAVAALHWWQDAEQQLPLPAIVLDVRVLELVASRVTTDSTWYGYLHSHHAAAWVRQQILNTLLDVVYAAVNNYAYQQVDPSEHDKLETLKRQVLGSASGKRFGFHLDEALAVLPTVAGTYPIHDDLGRRVRTLADQLSSPSALDSWCQDLEVRWFRALARLRRTRNALAHGGPLTPGCTDTVHGFARRLAGRALSRTLEGLLDGRSAVTAHDDFRDQADAWRAGVRHAASVHDALFRP
jgi:hypothetical protein